VPISGLATGPPAGVGGGSDRFWARELRVSQHFSTFYEPSVQAMDTQLNALPTLPVSLELSHMLPGSLGYNGITVISEPNRLKSATLSVKIWRMAWTCIVATMFASWTCLPPNEYVLSKPAR